MRLDGSKSLSADADHKLTHPRRDLLIVAAVACALRLLYLWQMRNSPVFDVVWGDGRVYDDWARRLAAGDWLGSGTFFHAPLYPYFLGIVYAVFGTHVWAARLVQAVVGTASCVLLAVAGRRFFGPRVGLVAGLLLACYPTAIFFDGLLQKTVLDTLFVTATLALIGGFLDEPGPLRSWFLAGTILGGFALTRENSLVLLPILCGWQFVYYRELPLGERARRAAIAVAGLTVVLLPVFVRNWAIAGEWQLTTSQFGPAFYTGNNSRATGTYVPLRPGRGDPKFERRDYIELAEQAVGRPLTSSEVSGYWRDQALEFIRAEPGRWLWLLGYKALLTVNATEIVDTDDPQMYCVWSPLLRLLYCGLHFGTILPAAAAGAWAARKEWRRCLVLYVMAAVYASGVIAFFVFERYRFPLVPIVLMLAAVGLTAFVEAVRSRSRSWIGLVTAATCAAVVAALPVVQDNTAALTYYNLGACLLEQKRWPEAEEYFRQSLALNPNSAGAHNNLGNVLARTAPLLPDQPRQVERNAAALAEFQRAVELEPQYAEAYSNAAIVLLRLGRADDAVAACRRALQLIPLYPEAHTNCASALVRLGRVDEAIAHLQRALEIDPANANAVQNLKIVVGMRSRR